MQERKTVRRRDSSFTSKISQYNNFCRALKEGDILYNKNTSLNCGNLFLVAAKGVVVLDDTETYLILLLGLKIKDDKIIPNGERIDLTPQKSYITVYLRKVGHCEYNLAPEMLDYEVNKGLMVVYKEVNLEKFLKVFPHKPKFAKYGDDGNPLVKSTTNKTC